MRPALPAWLVGGTCMALSPIFVRLSDVGPTASAFWRVALAAPLLWPLLALVPRTTRSHPDWRPHWRLLLAAGFAFAGDLAFWHWSIQFTSVANSTLLANLASLFVTLVAWIFWRERPSALFAVGLAAALGGVLLLVHASLAFSGTALLGDALGVVTAMFYAGYILEVKGLRDRGAGTLYLMAVTAAPPRVLSCPGRAA